MIICMPGRFMSMHESNSSSLIEHFCLNTWSIARCVHKTYIFIFRAELILQLARISEGLFSQMIIHKALVLHILFNFLMIIRRWWRDHYQFMHSFMFLVNQINAPSMICSLLWKIKERKKTFGSNSVNALSLKPEQNRILMRSVVGVVWCCTDLILLLFFLDMLNMLVSTLKEWYKIESRRKWWNGKSFFPVDRRQYSH